MEYTRVLIDTSVFIDYFRKESKLNTKLYILRKMGYEFVTSSICYFEYMSGSKNTEFDKRLFENIKVIAFDKEQAIVASEIFKNLKKNNKLIEFRDILIASASISLNIPLSTLNKKHFERIDGLKIVEV